MEQPKLMDARGKPLPEITAQTRPFWDAAKAGKLVMQKCGRCGTLNFFPKPWCIECGSRELAWTEVRPQGSVYSYTVAYKVMMNFPGWKDDLPLVMCIIDLDDGARMYGQLTGCAPEKVCIGMRVAAYFEDVSAEAAIPKFRPH
jgi:uncharacterized OB-fold protein